MIRFYLALLLCYVALSCVGVPFKYVSFLFFDRIVTSNVSLKELHLLR